MKWTKEDLKVENKKAKVVLLEEHETANNGGWYTIKFDNGDTGLIKFDANSKVHLVKNADWIEYKEKVNYENGLTFIEIIKGETIY